MARRAGIFLAVLAGLSVFSPSVQAQEKETWVEAPEIEDCTAGALIRPGDAENTTGDGHDLDHDTSVGGAESDSDAVWSTIAEAVDPNNLDEGIAHIITRSVIREGEIPIDQSLTLRGARENDVIITNDCPARTNPTSPTNAFVVSIGSGEVVVIENLVIRGFDVAFDCTGSTGGTLILRNCKIIDCDMAFILDNAIDLVLEDTHISTGSRGIDASSGSGDLTLTNTTIERMEYGVIGSQSQALRASGSRFVRNETAIADIGDLNLDDCIVSDNTQASITATTAAPWRITRSTIARNLKGLVSDASGSLQANITLIDSHVMGNGGSGLYVFNGLARISVSNSTISTNEEDGLRLRAGDGSRFSISESLIEANEDDGVFLENISGCGSLGRDGFEGHVSSTRIFANGDDGIDHGGNGTCEPLVTFASEVLTGLMNNAIVGNLGYALNERTSGCTFACGLGYNIILDNTSGAENGTGTTVCTGTSTSVNQISGNNN